MMFLEESKRGRRICIDDSNREHFDNVFTLNSDIAPLFNKDPSKGVNMGKASRIGVSPCNFTKKLN